MFNQYQVKVKFPKVMDLMNWFFIYLQLEYPDMMQVPH